MKKILSTLFLALLVLAGFAYVQIPQIYPLYPFEYIDFEIDAVKPGYTEGRIFYDDDEKTLSVYNNQSDVTLQLGQEMYVRGTNKTGSPILNGALVYINGAQGSRPTIALAKADALTTCGVLGMVTHDIADNATGFVTAHGLVHEIDTDGVTAGSALYLSAATAGAFTDTAPVAPNYLLRVGRCVFENSSSGVVYIGINSALYQQGHITDAPGDTTANNATVINAILAVLENAGFLEKI